MIPPRDGKVNDQLIENEQPEDRIKCSVQALRQENKEKPIFLGKSRGALRCGALWFLRKNMTSALF